VVAHLNPHAALAVQPAHVEFQAVVGSRPAVEDAIRHQLAHAEPQILDTRKLLLERELLYQVPGGRNGLRPAIQLDRLQ
jgi:hypothetical protein